MYDLKDIDGPGLMKLLATGLTKQANEVEIRTTEKDIDLRNLEKNFSEHYDMEIVEDKVIEVDMKRTVLIKIIIVDKETQNKIIITQNEKVFATAQ